ncbi:MAG: YbjQ family protein [Lachnospiraceae bacterium]|nr:YbjQ family protein [Lachnospiraceae bacterium]MBR2276232.1 YbjQ family protein [Lachnospiraceae bacterium]
MVVSTTENIGRNYEIIGIVKGSTVQTVNAIKDIGAGLKTIIGGELTKYNEMMDKARAMATERMIREAESLRANAIVGVRYSSASVMQGAAEIMAYGTAVKFTD